MRRPPTPRVSTFYGIVISMYFNDHSPTRTARVESVDVLDGYCVRLAFTDGLVREVDLEPFLRGPVFESLRTDRSLFESVAVDSELGTIVWPNGADIDPDVLHGDFEPAWRTESDQPAG